MIIWNRFRIREVQMSKNETYTQNVVDKYNITTTYQVKRVDGDFRIEVLVDGQRAAAVMLPGEVAKGIAKGILEDFK